MQIVVELAESTADKQLCDKFVVEHHSYVANAKTVGRVLKYMIFVDAKFYGTFWLGSGFKPTPKALLNHLGLSQKEFDPLFNTIADNKRFCVKGGVPNVGSRILRAVRTRAKEDWHNRYGDDLRAIVTTIGGGKTGAVYLADNWVVIGETSGLPSARKSVSMKWDDGDKIAERFVKPTGENKKLILFTDRL